MTEPIDPWTAPLTGIEVRGACTCQTVTGGALIASARCPMHPAEAALVRARAEWNTLLEAYTARIAELEAERDGYREHSVALNSVGWRINEALDRLARIVLDALAGAGQRTWRLPEEPGPEITAVHDRHGVRWLRAIRNAPGWRRDHAGSITVTWQSMLREVGPLTDASGEAK